MRKKKNLSTILDSTLEPWSLMRMIARSFKELQNVMGFSDHLPPSAGFCRVSFWLVGWLGFYLFVCFVLLFFLYTIVIIQHRKDYINMGGYWPLCHGRLRDAGMRTKDTQILHSLKESLCSEGLAKPSNDHSHQDQGWWKRLDEAC